VLRQYILLSIFSIGIVEEIYIKATGMEHAQIMKKFWNDSSQKKTPRKEGG